MFAIDIFFRVADFLRTLAATRWGRCLFFAIVAVVLALVAFVASAIDHTSTFTWSPPTTYSDGTALDPTDLLTYRIQCGLTEGGPYDLVSVEIPNVPPDRASHTETFDLPPGIYHCVMQAATAGGYSTDSNQVFFTVEVLPPSPPTDLNAG